MLVKETESPRMVAGRWVIWEMAGDSRHLARHWLPLCAPMPKVANAR